MALSFNSRKDFFRMDRIRQKVRSEESEVRPLWPSCSQLSVISLPHSVTLQQAEQLAWRIGGKRSNCVPTTPYGPNPLPIHHPLRLSVNILTGNICELLKPASVQKLCETWFKSVKRKCKSSLLYPVRKNENIKGGWASAHRSSLFCNPALLFSRAGIPGRKLNFTLVRLKM